MSEKKSREEKGKEGENYVMEVIRKATDIIGRNVKVFNHVILDFDSVYGKRTVEIDHIIVTNSRIIIVETKNGYYERIDYKAITWSHLDGAVTDNPIIQNHYHKQIFCPIYNIKREKVVTAEILLQYLDCDTRTQYANDYVWGKDNVQDGIGMLMIDDKDNFEFKHLCEQLEKVESMSKGREDEHIQNINEIREIEEKTRTRDKHYKFKRTDMVRCPACEGNLVFRYKHWVKYEIGNKKRTKNIALGCSNYASKQCNTFIKPTRDGGSGFDNIVAISIEERMEWTMDEQHVDTFWDKYNSLKVYNEEILDRLIKEKQNSSCKEKKIFELQKENEDLRKSIKSANERAKNAEIENKKYKRIFRKIYIKK